jgi:dipeptidyl aminopeptidase/acylaminoacyl peptidase
VELMSGALVAVLFGAAALPAVPRPFRLEDVAAFRAVREVAVSPDRTWAALLVREPDLTASRFRNALWTVPVDGSAPARRVDVMPAPESSLRWQPDGSRIAYLGRRGPGAQVFAVPLRGGHAVALTSHGTSVAAFGWAPGGGLLVVAPGPATKEEEQREKTHDDGWALGRQWRNHRAWLVSRGAFSPLTDGARHVRRAALSPDGTKVALITTPDPEADSTQDARLQVLDVGSGTVDEVPGSSMASEVEWSPKGRALAFVRPFDGHEISRADVYVWSAGESAARNVSSASDRDVEALRWSTDGGSIDVQLPEGARSAVSRFLPGTGTRDSLWRPAHGLALLERAGTGWVYVPSDRPAELWAAGLRGEAPRRLTRLNPDDIELPRAELMRWRSGTRDVEGILFGPANADGRPRPLVLHPHGGPRDHAGDDFDPLAAFLVAQGFLVLKPNFRGSTGYGDAFTRGNVEDWGAGPFADVMAGADAVIAGGRADGSRLFLYGWSYGGYLANWAITHTDRLRAAVSGAGVADLRMQYSISDARRWRFDYFRGSPFAGNEELYANQSPVTYARQARVPTLFIHGERDERCPPAQGLMMHRALRDNGVETEMVLYPREPHVFVEPRHLIDRARRVVEWFRAHGA